MSTLGPYDYWAVEYAYREMPAQEEAAALARIADAQQRAASSPSWPTTRCFMSGLDPQVNTFDLGADPLAYAARQR